VKVFESKVGLLFDATNGLFIYLFVLA